MPEYRREPLSGSWVIMAPERAARPTEFVTQPIRQRLEHCPFCAGNERFTPDPVAIYPPRLPSGDNAWQVRVVANKYPALIQTLEPAARGPQAAVGEGLFSALPGYGIHELIVESPQHTASFAELSSEQAFWSFVAYRDRLRELASRPQLRYGLVFKNCRGSGGATLEHSHSQVLATSLVVEGVERELRTASEFFHRQKSCIFCHILEQELAAEQRIVAMSSNFVAFCPYASRFPYETWVVPRTHSERFHQVNLEDLRELSQFFLKLMQTFEKILPQAPHNYWIHNSPFDTLCYEYYHWHIEFIPRISYQGGFEWGSGCFVNSVMPEEAAVALRSVPS